jgi:NADH dehydrogenase (ubiquinone) 1 alpha subcomplex subunit 13
LLGFFAFNALTLRISFIVGWIIQIDIVKRARARGPTGAQIWLASSLAIAYGFYRVGKCNKARNGEKLEERKARYAMASILQAEEDRFYVQREQEIMKKEAEIMKNVPGWKVGESPYSSDRWVPRHVAPLNKNIKK